MANLTQTETRVDTVAGMRSIYGFGGGKADGGREDKALLGGKGANCAEMARIGLPVPAGFTITTAVCNEYLERFAQNPEQARANPASAFPDGLEQAIAKSLAVLEEQEGRKFGDSDKPLLVSVRSGAQASMPGMMDTVLNLGLNPDTVQGLAEQGNPRFAYDSWRRFIQMFSDVVLGLPHGDFEEILEEIKDEQNVLEDSELDAEALQTLCDRYLELVAKTGTPFPQDPIAQLHAAIGAVFRSWSNTRAKTYRRLNNIPDNWGTAVTVQAMVFGNLGSDCATGVAFTRDPSTGENLPFGEYLINAQGEDVVAGIRTPRSLTIAGRKAIGSNEPALEEAMPEAFAELMRIRTLLEQHYKDMQDLEFTIQSGRLYMLQTRSGKRSVSAAIRIAAEMAGEGLISQDQALMRVEPESVRQILHPTLAPDSGETVELTRGLPASPGAASGIVVFSAAEAERLAPERAVILCRSETSPEDIQGMYVARGILTTRGGMTSHAAVVARGMGRPCVVGAGSLHIDEEQGVMTGGGQTIRAGDEITVDGTGGRILLGEAKMTEPNLGEEFTLLMQWADSRRRMKVRANAETPADCKTAIRFGAEGIGLCRTEHMFFQKERMLAMREVIVAQDETGRRAALAKLQPVQREDFAEIFRIMEGRPVTVRLLDPPLHEFLPRGAEEQATLAEALGISASELRGRVSRLTESNPMLGHRGCRLAMTYPEVYEMQLRALFEAAHLVAGEGVAVSVEVMIPLVAFDQELARLRQLSEAVAQEIAKQNSATADKVQYIVGTMIELPRAALCADTLAKQADFFSFGTNDLTQTALGLSRDDTGPFLPYYESSGVIPRDPFASLDLEGVGQLVKLGVERGRASRPDLKLGICGEHGGDPASVEFFDSVGLDYVSCSPFRLPIARLAAAQAQIRKDRKDRKDTDS